MSVHAETILPIVRLPTPEPRRCAGSDFGVVRTLPMSVFLHGLMLAAFWLFSGMRPLEDTRVPSIAVQIISEVEFLRATQPPAPSPPEPAPAPLIVARPPAPPPEPLPETADSEMIPATRFLASDILSDPENQQVRDTLTLLDRSERITQLCNIEALEQLHLLHPDQLPDSLDPSAMAETSVKDLTLEAPGGAYRLNQKWYEIRVSCTVASDYLSVSAFAFAPGPAIPKDQWESHNLIDEDVELD